MSYETLTIIWFSIWGLIWAIYFVLEGYTAGTGILFPFLAKKEEEQRQLQESIGPFWGSNEVWLITAGGVTFAAFPETYGTMFSTFYIPLYLILFALFFRATGLEFMHKSNSSLWKQSWKWAFFSGSLLIPFLFGLTFSALFRGLSSNEHGLYITFSDVINAYGILGGSTFVLLSLLSSAIWISIKTEGAVQKRATLLAKKIWPISSGFLSLFFIATTNQTSLFNSFANEPVLWLIPGFTLLFILFAGIPIVYNKWGMGFAFVSLSIFTLFAAGFTGMFPNMLPARMNSSFSLTLYEAAGSELNLTIMLWITFFIVPVVILYQIWMYRIFRGKITEKNARGY
ncbi:MAG TPA: cytochrome d ubiquinol oxidase subunit II [Paenibacillaceae bacterium]|nr:cytochrome d ubiquinol oxidase subunit II [Paenibacillaceae bacterium]